MMFLRITLAIIITSNLELVHSFTTQAKLSNTLYGTVNSGQQSQSVIALLNSVKDEAYTLPVEDEDAKVTGRKWVSWGRDLIPIIRRKRAREEIVQTVSTLEEYKEAVADETEKIVVVRFYASWCKACHAIKPEYYRLAKQLKEQGTNIKFVEVPLTQDNAFLHQGLGVPSIPYGHIYHPNAGLVEEQSVSKKNFRTFKTKLNSYVIGSCEVDDVDKFMAIDTKDVGTKLTSETGVFE